MFDLRPREEFGKTTVTGPKDFFSEIRNLEKDLSIKGLSNKGRKAIVEGIQEEASNLLRRIGDGLEMGTFFDSSNIRQVCYRGAEEGIDLFLNGTILEIESHHQSGIYPEVNMGIRANGVEASLQLSFDGVVNQAIMRDLIQIQNVLNGDYTLSDTRMRSTPMLVVNPIQHGPQFVEEASRIYKKLQEYEKADELYNSRGLVGEKDDEVGRTAKGVYAKNLLGFLGVDL